MLKKVNNYIPDIIKEKKGLILCCCLGISIAVASIINSEENPSPKYIDLDAFATKDKISLMISTNLYESKISSFLGWDILRDAQQVGFIHMFGHDMGSIEETRKKIQSIIEEYEEKGLIPPMFSMDFEGGFVNHIDFNNGDLKKFGFSDEIINLREKEYNRLSKKYNNDDVGLGLLPSAEFLGKEYKKLKGKKKTDFLNMMREYGKAVSRIAKYIGIQMVYGPVLDLIEDLDSENLIAKNDRSFGTDPGIVSELGISFIQGFKESSVIVVPKHFSGTGSVKGDLHDNQLKSTYGKRSGAEIPFGNALMNGFPSTYNYNSSKYQTLAYITKTIERIDREIQNLENRNIHWKKLGKYDSINANNVILKKKKDERKRLLIKLKKSPVKELYENRYIPDAILIGQSSNDNFCSGIPNTLCPVVYDTLSRKKAGYGFKGLMVTDDMYMGAIDEYANENDLDDSPENIIFSAISSGADVVLHRFLSDGVDETVEKIERRASNLPENEKLKFMETINKSVNKILETRRKMGNMEKKGGKYYYINN